ncbi:hypothetical protein AJ80_09925 [Polytolypa hystricis UAMH7299]|uniref:Uncharacterized protein n=1 Tax=Polytolypa hystricis (strain UAMH7299) TaxID=1447883 RepID=A0A2B7WGG7_POLH7|nr:hypothetical protein AJ80_09925 [Polytolypa hystricis UAMH7299]
MLDVWRDVRFAQQKGDDVKGGEEGGLVVPERIKYRATNPLYAGEEYGIVMSEIEGKKKESGASGGVDGGRMMKGAKMEIFTQEGVLCMKGDIGG